VAARRTRRQHFTPGSGSFPAEVTMRELFIYYRSRQDEVSRVASLVLEFQSRLAATHPGLAARLLRRPEIVDGTHTWMETYSMNPMHSPNGISPALAQEIERQAEALRPCLAGERHIEVFTPCA
jgi:hypothetical protein